MNIPSAKDALKQAQSVTNDKAHEEFIKELEKLRR
jgi:hypothetical protein